MKLLTFRLNGTECLGALTDTGVVNLTSAAPEDFAFSSMQNFIEAGHLVSSNIWVQPSH